MHISKEDTIRFLRYFCSAAAAVMVNVVSRVLFSRLGLAYGVSIVVAYFCGHIVNYTLSVLFVFSKNSEKKASLTTFLRFTLVACGGLAVTFFSSILLRKVFIALFSPQANAAASGALVFSVAFLETAAHIASTGISFVVNYVGHLLFSFRKK